MCAERENELEDLLREAMANFNQWHNPLRTKGCPACNLMVRITKALGGLRHNDDCDCLECDLMYAAVGENEVKGDLS